MKIGKKKVLTLHRECGCSSDMQPRCHCISGTQMGLLYGFDHDMVWQAVMQHIRRGHTLLLTEYTQMQHKRTKQKGILLQATFQP